MFVHRLCYMKDCLYKVLIVIYKCVYNVLVIVLVCCVCFMVCYCHNVVLFTKESLIEGFCSFYLGSPTIFFNSIVVVVIWVNLYLFV